VLSIRIPEQMRVTAALLGTLLLCGLALTVSGPPMSHAQTVSEAEMRAAQSRAGDLTPADRARILEMLGAQNPEIVAEEPDSLATPTPVPQFTDRRPPRTLAGEALPDPPEPELVA